MPATSSASYDRPTVAFAIALIALLALRVSLLALSPLELQFDEAQYWYWSRTFDWGYFSKPPLIAWAIAATTNLFGNAEWAVRLAAPLAHCAGAVALFLLGRSVYSPWAGFWAGFGWLVMPAVWLSSFVISTDALLLPLWSFALLALWRFFQTGDRSWAIALGVAIGLGALAKYAMLYFLLCGAVAALWSPALRARFLGVNGAIVFAATVLVVTPNLIWNATHRFATISHTAANADAARWGLHPDELFEFLQAQLLVIGPIALFALAWLIFGALRKPRDLGDFDKIALSFIAPPLIVIMAQALLSHAHANWAATAYPAAIVWLAGRLSQSKGGRLTLIAASVTHLALGGVASAATLNAHIADRLGLGNAFEDGRGWREVARETEERARRLGPFTAIGVDHRSLFFELTYYWTRERKNDLPPLRMWVLHADAKNHAEASAPLTKDYGARVLLVMAQQREGEELAGDFSRFTPLELVEIDRGKTDALPLLFAIGEGFSPKPRDAAFEARLE